MTLERRAAATRLAARLLFGAGSPEPDPDALDEETFVHLAVRNKAPLALVEEAAVEAGLPERWDRARDLAARERGRHAVAVEEFSAVAAAWAEGGVDAVLIKSPGYFPYTSDNVDVLVASAAAARARAVLEDRGYRELPWVREPFKVLFRKVRGEPAGFAIHLHTRVAWINTFFEDSRVLEGSEPFGGDGVLRRPRSDMAFLITTAHWFYEDKEVKLRDLYHSREILRAEIDWEKLVATAARGGWQDGFTTAVRLLGRAAADLGLHGLAERLPSLPPSSSRLAPGFSSGTPVASLPAEIHRRKAKAMHFVKSLRNPGSSLPGRAQEATLVAAYALKVRFPVLQRAPMFVVVAPEAGTDLDAALGRTAATLRTRFSLPLEMHDDGERVSPGMFARGGIHVVRGGPPEGRVRRWISLRPAQGGVHLSGPAAEDATIALDAGDEVAVATAIARAYLESIA